MKKHLILLLAALILSTASFAQKEEKVEAFINEYELFVKDVVRTPFSEFQGERLHDVEKMQKKFLRRYRWHFDKRMSEDQMEQFNKLRGKYKRKIASLNSRRRRAAMKGYVKGLFEKDKVDEEVDEYVPEEPVLAPAPEEEKTPWFRRKK